MKVLSVKMEEGRKTDVIQPTAPATLLLSSSLVFQVVKNLPAMCETQVGSLGC